MARKNWLNQIIALNKKRTNKLIGAFITAVLALQSMLSYGQSGAPASLVNPFIGASTNSSKAKNGAGLGKTFPGAATPFGLVQLSPNTITGGDNGSGYSYEHQYIEGFAFTQMSGVGWYGDLGNLLTIPTTGPLHVISGRNSQFGKGYRSKYDKKTEIATAGYYAATLTDYNIRTEATVAPHSGMLKFTFPQNKRSRIQIDLARRVSGASDIQYVKVIDQNTIAGWMKCTPEGGGWGDGNGHANYTVYFYMQFSKRLKNYGVWSADIPDGEPRKNKNVTSVHYDSLLVKASIIPGFKEIQGKSLGFYTEFETGEHEEVYLRSGISFVSMEGAKENLQKEITDWNFNDVHNRAVDLWNTALSKIKIEGGTKDQQITYYTALYHSMIDPRNVSDINGNYLGGDGKVHQTQKFNRRTIFSGWDVFRSQFPLQTIINPTVVSDMINSLVELKEETGKNYLERWEFLNAYSGIMVGNPAVSVITDAYYKGIRNFDVDKAYKASVATVERIGNKDTLHAMNISSTLEQAYSEWCVAKLAGSLNHPDDVKKYSERSLSYKRIFDQEKNAFRPRQKDGSFVDWPAEGRLKQGYGTAESNSYQQGWFVPQDIGGLVKLMGGRGKVIADLEDFFEKTPLDFKWNNYYNHANEPVHHVPFLFNRLGTPWLTQKWARIICENAYSNSVEGLVGNDDVGQMSAWYVLASSGFHPICPGDPRYELCSPLFSKISIHASGKMFTIQAINNAKDNKYIQSAKLNGIPYNKCWIAHQDIINGGILELVMGNSPNKSWGIE